MQEPTSHESADHAGNKARSWASVPARRMIGRREFVAFPQWGVKGIEAKIDTGARTSAIHVEDAVRLKNGRVRFHLITSRRKPFKRVEITADLARVTRVRSSTGHVQERLVVSTLVKIGNIRRRIEMSLVGRDKMLCRMLLGRTALTGFLIDPDTKYLYGKPVRKHKREPHP